MKSNKTIVIKCLVDKDTNIVFRRILKIKQSTIQSVMEKLLRDYIYENLKELINYNK